MILYLDFRERNGENMKDLLNVGVIKAPFAPRTIKEGAASIHLGHIISLLRTESEIVNKVTYLDFNKSNFFRFSHMFSQLIEKDEFWGAYLNGERTTLLERALMEVYVGIDGGVLERNPDLPSYYIDGLLHVLKLVFMDFIAPLVEQKCDVAIICASRSIFYQIILGDLLKKELPNIKIIVVDNFTFESCVPYFTSFLAKKGYMEEDIDIMLLGDPLLQTFSHSFPHIFDYLVDGEGYDFIRKIFKSNLANNRKIVSRVFNKDGEITSQNDCLDIYSDTASVCLVVYSERIELDSMPLPDYSDMDSIYDFAEFEYMRGCNYACAFCERTRTMNHIIYKHSIEYMMRLFEHLKQYNFNKYTLIDCAMNNDEAATIELLQEMQRQNIKLVYQCNLRGKTPNEELLKLLQATGCEQIGIGLETGDDTLLKSMNKQQNSVVIKEMAASINKFNMKMIIFLIIGFPTEKFSSVDRTINLLREINEKCKISIVACEQYYTGHVQLLRPAMFKHYGIEWIPSFSKNLNNNASYFFNEFGVYGLAVYNKGMSRKEIKESSRKYIEGLNSYGIPIDISV